MRIQLAFAAKAATTPAIARLQRTVLDDVRRSIATAFGAAWTQPADSHRCSLAAAAVLAAVDGLALHAVSADLNPTQGQPVAALDLILTAILDKPAGSMSGRPSMTRTTKDARSTGDAGSPATGPPGARR